MNATVATCDFSPSAGTPHHVPQMDAGSAATPALCLVPPDAAGSRGTSAGGLSAIVVTAEKPADAAAREALLDRAMGPGRKRKSSEKLRRGRRPSEGLALVARNADGDLVGTVRLWDVTVESPAHVGGSPDAGTGTSVRALLLGPLAVDPSLRSAGIGAALMRHAIEEARRLGHGAILLVGDPGYYARFGFGAARTVALAMPGPYEPHRLLALELVEGTLDGAHGVLAAAGRRAPAAFARTKAA